MRLGLVGSGYWGPNYVNTCKDFTDADLVWVCDKSPEALGRVKTKGLQLTNELSDLLNDPTLDGLIIATPTAAHYRMAKEALEAGKHVLVEKPVTMSSRECAELEQLAASKGRVLMAGHTYLYNDGVRFLEKHIHDKDKFGDIQGIECYWQSHGAFRTDMNVIWDLAPHGVSVSNYLAHDLPRSVQTLGTKYDSLATKAKAEAVLMLLQYPAFSSVVKVSWQHPRKQREVYAIGTKQMVLFDDVNTQAPVTIYEKSAVPHGERIGADYGSFKMITRDGGTHTPVVRMGQPLKSQLADFCEAITTGNPPLASARNGREVVRILEAADESLQRNGQEIPLNW
jgi:predicted dehydrogenase